MTDPRNRAFDSRRDAALGLDHEASAPSLQQGKKGREPEGFDLRDFDIHVDDAKNEVEAAQLALSLTQILGAQHEIKAALQRLDLVSANRERNEERFHFVHPEIGDEEAWHTHDMVKRLVVNYRMPDICAFLKDKNQDRKILLPSNPSFVYLELVRMGMPTGEGFSEKNFSNNYVR